MAAEFGDQLIVVANHIYDIYEIPWTEGRKELYSSGVLPRVFFDGKYSIYGATSTNQAADRYREVIEQRLAETNSLSQIEAHGQHWFVDETVQLSATFTREGSEPLTSLRAYLIVMVNGLLWGGNTFDHVVQAVYEQDVVIDDVHSAVTIQAGFPLDPEWSPEDLECIAFIQEMHDSLAVVQSVRLPLDTPPSDCNDHVFSSGPAIRLCPNPVMLQGNLREIRFQLTDTSATELVSGQQAPMMMLYDTTGHMIRRLSPVLYNSNKGAVSWDGKDSNYRDVPAGVYWVKASHNDVFFGTRLILLR